MTIIQRIRRSYATVLLLLGICSIFGLGFIMYKVLPRIYEAGPTAWLVSYALILAVVFALFVLGIFLGYFYGSPKGRWLSSKKTRKQFREALSFERGERIRLERELFETKSTVADLKDRNVERATAEVVHGDGLRFLFLVEPVGERGCRRLVDDAQDFEA